MPPRRRLPREVRARRAERLARDHDGVAHRADLRAVGVTRADVRTEVEAGRWSTAGRHTVVIGNTAPVGRALWWRALWETGAGAALDGAVALVASGLAGFAPLTLDVSVPRANRSHQVEGVRRHRRMVMPPVVGAGIPRVRVPEATVLAAARASSDRTAMLLLCLVLQQRLTSPDRLLSAWRGGSWRMGPARRQLLELVVADLCDGAHSLGRPPRPGPQPGR